MTEFQVLLAAIEARGRTAARRATARAGDRLTAAAARDLAGVTAGRDGDDLVLTSPGLGARAFPLDLGYGATGGPQFSTQVVTTGSGFEQRNSGWADARLHYDAGVGVRSEADLSTLIAFFRARRGQAHGFRFSDPFDHDAVNEPLGSGDGVRTRFDLLKTYGSGDDAQVRRITRPVAGSVSVKVGGVVATGWTLGDLGALDFAAAPPAGAAVTASFAFDVPVRFAEDRIDVGLASWRAGDVPSVPLIEVREA